MPNNGEIIEKLARESERLQLLAMATEAKSLDDLIAKLKAITPKA